MNDLIDVTMDDASEITGGLVVTPPICAYPWPQDGSGFGALMCVPFPQPYPEPVA